MPKANLSLLIVMSALSAGCVTEPSGTYELADAETGVIVSNLTARTVRANCLVEKNKISLPEERAKRKCKNKGENGLDSFASGWCVGAAIDEENAYKAELRQARDDRAEVYSVCLLKNGLTEIWVPTPINE
ncbi:hypothetical protein N9393_05510 [Luminiphilus sp.]|nr:hypothetical protein [Luminiphilus sp.]